MKAKPVVPREQANRDVEEAVGYYLSGAQPIDKFRRIVDRAMKDAGVPVPAAAPAGAAPGGGAAPAAPKPIAQ